MGRFFKFLVGSILIVTISFGIYEITNKYQLNIISENVDWSINAKGCSGAKAFDFDEYGNLYIAFNNSIKIIKKDSNEEILIKKSSFEIYDITTFKEYLFIATDNRVVKYNMLDSTSVDIVKDLPNKGLNKETKLILNNDKLYIAVGTNTNSGIAESGGDYDKPSFHWTLTGNNYGEVKTGPFSPYGVFVEPEAEVKEVAISNGVVLCYDIDSEKITTFATGIRNIEGMDIDSNNNLMAIVGGMEDFGARAVKDDMDYVYEIKEKAWYGWPDFSGGDPITSPRFSDGNSKLEFLIKNHPTEVPYGPIYQHKSLSSLRGLAIDTEGEIFTKDTMIVGDNKQNYIYAISKGGGVFTLIDLGDNSNIQEIKWFDGSIYVLDNKVGCLYTIKQKSLGKVFNLPKIFWIFIIGFTIIVIIIVGFRLNLVKDKEKN